MTIDTSRRTALVSFGALAVGTAALAAGPSRAATTERIIPAEQELSAIGKSYETMASSVVGGELVRRQLHDGSQASPQQMQRLSGSASRV